MTKNETDFWCYVRFRRIIGSSFCPWPFALPPRGKVSALKAFIEFDGRGKAIPTRQPRLLKAAVEGKKLLNFQIKEWAAGWSYCGRGAFVLELQEDLPWLPEWVWKSLEGQVEKLRYNDIMLRGDKE